MQISSPITLDQLITLIDERISQKLGGGGRNIIRKHNR